MSPAPRACMRSMHALGGGGAGPGGGRGAKRPGGVDRCPTSTLR